MSIQSSGKLINNRNGNFEFWSATFTFFGVNKTDGKSLLNLKYRKIGKV